MTIAYLRLLVDLFSIKLLVAMFGARHGGQVLDSHLFFYHRYTELADYHRARGRTHKADRLEGRAEWHYQAAPGDDGPGDDDHPPEAAAMAMPVPRKPININAVSTVRMRKPTLGDSALVPNEAG